MLMVCHIKYGLGVSGYLVADELDFKPRGRKWRRRFLIENFGEFFWFCLTVESSLLLRMRSFGGAGGRASPGPSRRVEESQISKSPSNPSQIRTTALLSSRTRAGGSFPQTGILLPDALGGSPLVKDCLTKPNNVL
jgi:hypothetical protein